MKKPPWEPVTFENCNHVTGPFYHGTKAHLAIGALLSPGYPSNYEEGRVSNHIYFSANLEPAVWGAEIAMSLASLAGRGHIYLVEPTGTFEDDPNLTNKRFPGNPTKSYRTRDPLRIIGVVEDWQGHSEEMVRSMLDALLDLQRRGLAIIEDSIRNP
ncbi:MAG: NAD(+)--rifampin ADP-ribosyltransferase [Blastocatellia bacterium]|nr:NAD(+)--rifampin ADP-ribosyltransferase [Blastocatellia bacterium]